jgi:hypothetical protein
MPAARVQMSKHPNIVSYIETYLWEDNIWLIMECMDGGCVVVAPSSPAVSLRPARPSVRDACMQSDGRWRRN